VQDDPGTVWLAAFPYCMLAGTVVVADDTAGVSRPADVFADFRIDTA